MSEIYKRSLGQTFNEHALAVELGGGTAGYDTIPEEVIEDNLSIKVYDNSNNELQYVLAQAAERVDASELTYEQVKERFNELTAKESVADYIELVAQLLIADYDRRKSDGQPIGDEFYVEAFDTAEAIAVANTDFTQVEFTAAADALIQLQYAERKLADAERELMSLVA